MIEPVETPTASAAEPCDGVARPTVVRVRVLVLAALMSLAAGCGSAGLPHGRDPAAGGSTAPSAGGGMPARIPAAGGVVTTRGLVTVLDRGDGPVLCLGAVALSYPPQCGGPPLRGFSWSDRRGTFEQAAGVRWGLFVVTGTFDGTALTVQRVLPEALYDAAGPTGTETKLATPCPAPAEGWRVLDPARTTATTLQEALARAARLPGYADAWLDQSRNPARGRHTGDLNDPAYVIVNVRVTHDVQGAEEQLRAVWGGALCVTRALRTRAQLLGVQREVQGLPGMLTSAPGRDVVDVEVVHDDGSLQDWADATHGRGLVRITSALVPLR